MRLSVLVLAACVAFTAAKNVVEPVDVITEEVSPELGEELLEDEMEENADERELAYGNNRNKFRKNRNRNRNKNRLRNRNKNKYKNTNPYYKDPYYKDPFYKDPFYNKDPYQHKDSYYKKKHNYGKCVLTACIDTYIDRYDPDVYHPYYKNGHLTRKLYHSGYRSAGGTVTLIFDEYDYDYGYKHGNSYQPGHHYSYKSKYYYAPSFKYIVDVYGLPPETKGALHVHNSKQCANVHYGDVFWNVFKLHKNPWTDDVGYYTNEYGKDYAYTHINDGYDCDSHVGKSVVMKIDESDKYGAYYACGILKKNNHCGYKSKDYYW